MTGKEKLIEWIRVSDIVRVAELMNSDSYCPSVYGINKKGKCDRRRDCENCWREALEKEYLEGRSMIDKNSGFYHLTCDICDKEADEVFAYFDDAVDYKESQGWKSQRDKREWQDACPECARLSRR